VLCVCVWCGVCVCVWCVCVCVSPFRYVILALSQNRHLAGISKTRQAVHCTVLYVQRNIETRSCNHCYSGKTIPITHCECLTVFLGIQHAMRMRRMMLPSVACPALLYFSTLSHNGTIFKISY